MIVNLLMIYFFNQIFSIFQQKSWNQCGNFHFFSQNLTNYVFLKKITKYFNITKLKK